MVWWAVHSSANLRYIFLWSGYIENWLSNQTQDGLTDPELILFSTPTPLTSKMLNRLILCGADSELSPFSEASSFETLKLIVSDSAHADTIPEALYVLELFVPKSTEKGTSRQLTSMSYMVKSVSKRTRMSLRRCPWCPQVGFRSSQHMCRLLGLHLLGPRNILGEVW